MLNATKNELRMSRLRALRLNIISKLLRKNIQIGSHCNIEKHSTIDIINGGEIIIGDKCWIHRGSMILSFGGKIRIGDHCTINPYCILYGHGGLTIGNYVRIAAQTIIIPGNHNFGDIAVPIFKQGLTCRGIIIEDDVWIGAGVRVLDGVVIREGCVIGAGGVLTKSTDPYGIYAGVPAKKIGRRGPG